MMPSSFLLFLLQLCCLQMMLVSIPTCMLPGNVVEETLKQLHFVNKQFPKQCHEPNNEIYFPVSALSNGSTTCRWTSQVLYECLRGAEHMFAEYDLPKREGKPMWSGKNFSYYENLQYRLVEDHQCLSTTEASGVLSPYFSNITAVVEQQDGSACGWEILRSDLLYVLRHVVHKHRRCLNWTRAH